MTESELISRLKQGDNAAFAGLVSMYRHRVINTCFRFLLNEQDAEDTSQEVFVEVYHSIGSFRGASSLSTWIYRIAVTKCLDEIKRRNRKKRITSIGRLLHLEEVAHWLTGTDKADTRLMQKESRAEIDQALSKLPDSQRVAFTLSNMQGFSNAEIADIMQTTQVAVESLLYRARKRLGQQMQRDFGKNA
jgi:RNA polymerase sigma-70 factor (ECF subfamily)